MDHDSISKSKSPPSNTTPVRVSKSTSRLLRSLLIKCNRKNHGRKVRADDVINKALTILQDSHLEEIKSLTYSSQDHLEIQFKKYCQQHGSISKNAFLQLLLTKALPEFSKQQPKNQESK